MSSLVWMIVSWVITSLAGVLVGALTVGKAVGRWTATVEAKIEAESKTRAAEIATERAAREAQIASEREGRARLHRDLEAVSGRLRDGDHKFERQLIALTELAAQLKGTVTELGAFQSAMGGLVDKDVCAAERKAIDHRLERLEATHGRPK